MMPFPHKNLIYKSSILVTTNCIKMKQTEYSIIGFFVGAIIGVLIGLGFMNQFKESQRASIMPISLIAFGISFGASGAAFGSKLGNDENREKELGLDKSEDGYFQDGKYWVGYTKWKNPSTGEAYELHTTRSNGGS